MVDVVVVMRKFDSRWLAAQEINPYIWGEVRSAGFKVSQCATKVEIISIVFEVEEHGKESLCSICRIGERKTLCVQFDA
jgi:hypothetical protein